MRTLSKQAEAKLISAIEKAALYANEGMTPNDAIVKSAAEADIPAGHVNLMVHAYNTGRTTKQREQGENTIEKAADFQLADAAVVLKTLYPETVKTSAEVARARAVSTEYAVSPIGMLQRRQNDLRKAAAVKAPLPDKTYVPPPRDEHAAAMRARSEKIAAQRAEEEQRRVATTAYAKAAAAMDEIAEYFRRPGNMPFGDAVREVRLRLGDDGVSVLEKVSEVYPQLKKQAATNSSHFGDDPLYGVVTRVVTHLEEYVAYRPQEKKAEKKNLSLEPSVITGSVLDSLSSAPVQLKKSYDTTGAGRWHDSSAVTDTEVARLRESFGLNPPPPEPPPPPPSWSDTPGRPERPVGRVVGDFTSNLNAPEDSVLSSIGAVLAGPRNAAVGAIGKELFDPEKAKKMKMDQYSKLTAPDHETALKNIKAQATLHDMLLNDEVVSGYDPKEVAIAFNEIANVAPGVVDSPAVLQALLRKRLEAGTLADFDVKQLLEMDKLKAERDKIRTETMERERSLV
jgi:hypothetical protein